MPLKIAVIGCGWVSMECHGPAYQEYARNHADIVLSACCDLDAQRSEAFRSRFGFQRAYTDVGALLEQEQPGAVALNVPPQQICALGRELLRRGIPLLSEKPPGLTVAEIDRLIDAAQASGTIHQVAFNRRFLPLMGELKRRLAGKPVHHVDGQMARVRRADADFSTTAVHLIDALRFVVESDFTGAQIAYQELPEQGTGVANFRLDGQFASGATAHLSIFPVSGYNVERITVYALDHTFQLHASNGPDAPGRLLHFHNGQLAADLDGAQITGRAEAYFLNGFYQEDAAFLDAVRAGRQPEHDFASCRQSVALMQCLAERRTRYPG